MPKKAGTTLEEAETQRIFKEKGISLLYLL